MKRIIAITALALLAVFSKANAQEAITAKDTLSLKFFEMLDKGDSLPFKYVYQKAKLGKDTILTARVSKDIELYVAENDKESQFVIFDVISTNFEKFGEEANDPDNLRTTCVVADGYPVQIKVWYNGDAEYVELDDTLKARAQKNLLFIADTLQKGKFSNVLNKEEIAEKLDYLVSPGFAVSQATSSPDFGEMFKFYFLKYQPNEVYGYVDSVYCDLDGKMYPHKTVFQWDENFSTEVPDYENFYVLRSGSTVGGLMALSVMGIVPDEEDYKLLEDEANTIRCIHVTETTMLADKGMGVPALVDIQLVGGFYEKIGDEYLNLEKIIIMLDFEKMMADEGGDDEEEDESDEPRYDDYGFIKVK